MTVRDLVYDHVRRYKARPHPVTWLIEAQRRGEAGEYNIPTWVGLNLNQHVKGQTWRWNSKLGWEMHSLELDNTPSHAAILGLLLFHDFRA